jgi:hypothetical protein
VDAFPLSAAVIVPAAKLPEPSLVTIALFVLVETAVVLALGRVPVTPVVNGTPVTFVPTKALGVPRSGVLSKDSVTVPLLFEAITGPEAAALGKTAEYAVTEVGA